MRESWTPWRRVAFRFGVAYFSAYALLNGNTATLPLAFLTKQGRPPDSYSKATDAVVGGVGHALGVRGELHAFDNGDTVGDHVALLCFVLLALVGTVAWSVLQRDRLEYRRGLELLRRAVRWVLAMTVFAYAIFKVFPAQFSVPSPSRLVQTYGASSRMGLMWTFMGASPAYQMFAGWTELLGCVLVMFRRTTTLGALVLVAVLGNVLVMDICYDVYAKVCVVHLLGMVGFLLLPDAIRLFDVLVRNRAVSRVDLGPPSSRVDLAATVAFVLLVLGFEGVPVARFYFAERDGAPVPALYGAYEVTEMRRGGQVAPPLLGDPSYWHFIAIDRRRAAAVLAGGSQEQFRLVPAPDGRLTLERGTSSLSASAAGTDEIVLDGALAGVPLSVRARRIGAGQERLVREPVRWFYDEPAP